MNFIKEELQIDNNNVDDFDLYAVKVELNDIDGELVSVKLWIFACRISFSVEFSPILESNFTVVSPIFTDSNFTLNIYA